jgi:acetolactate synthase small subunit
MGEAKMHVFHIHYRNTQGTLMRILNAASRRALEMPYVHARANQSGHQITLLLEVNPKQMGQLTRDWYAIVDVSDVRAGAPTPEMLELAADLASSPHPPASAATGEAARAAMA